MNPLQIHEEAIRSQVCVECIYPSGSGVCGAGHAEQCPLNTLLPRAVEAVKSGKSATILDYLQTLRISQSGRNGSANNLMSSEEAMWLERSLPLIAAAVEEADGHMSRSKVKPRKSGI